MSKVRKYEGKWTALSVQRLIGFASSGVACSVVVPATFCVSFILAAKSFSEMFTTYSHALLFLPRQRA